ncbi:MAG TPA: LysR family transcriptional regulator [Polyangium sp.]|jgi:DNA-binding transcriptional LysR family regulator|nr:LysR family transcriptional regulator [Polyangium sp.]
MNAMLDDVVSMAVFARVVQAGSFTGAAAMLGLSKSVVSTRISELETRLGVRLLHRTTRRLSLTPDGAHLHERCLRLVAAADEAREALDSALREPDGVVRMSVPVGMGLWHLPKLVRDLHALHPRLVLDISLSDHHVDLVADGFDLAVRVAEKLEPSTLMARRIGRERVIVCASPEYLARHKEPRVPEDLVHHNCLRISSVTRTWTFRSGRHTHKVTISGSFITDNIVMLRQATLDGVGLSRLPMSVASADIDAKRLRQVLPDYTMGETSVFIVHPYGKQMPTKVRAVIDGLLKLYEH